MRYQYAVTMIAATLALTCQSLATDRSPGEQWFAEKLDALIAINAAHDRKYDANWDFELRNLGRDVRVRSEAVPTRGPQVVAERFHTWFGGFSRSKGGTLHISLEKREPLSETDLAQLMSDEECVELLTECLQAVKGDGWTWVIYGHEDGPDGVRNYRLNALYRGKYIGDTALIESSATVDRHIGVVTRVQFPHGTPSQMANTGSPLGSNYLRSVGLATYFASRPFETTRIGHTDFVYASTRISVLPTLMNSYYYECLEKGELALFYQVVLYDSPIDNRCFQIVYVDAFTGQPVCVKGPFDYRGQSRGGRVVDSVPIPQLPVGDLAMATEISGENPERSGFFATFGVGGSQVPKSGERVFLRSRDGIVRSFNYAKSEALLWRTEPDGSTRFWLASERLAQEIAKEIESGARNRASLPAELRESTSGR